MTEERKKPICGCDRKIRCRGLCKRHYLMLKADGRTVKPKQKVNGRSVQLTLPRSIMSEIREEAKHRNVYVAEVIRKYLCICYGLPT